MADIRITVHGLEPNGVCSLSGKEGEVLVLTMEDGTAERAALSPKSLLQLLRMKLSQAKKPLPRAEPVEQPNGIPK